MPATRSQREALHIEPNAVYTRRNDDAATPVSAATTESPITPLVATPPSAISETSEADNDGNASAGSDSIPSSGRRSREKKKRSRVTPEQLVHLERYFTVDRSPTAARRREISDLLGMQERQTQIWFQNRRAKAKMLDGKVKDCSATEVPLDTSPSKHDIDLHNIIHEDDAVTFLPCTDLSVGTWRRIATTVSQHDLIAYVCEGKQSLAWFILSGGNGFKMEIPFHRIVRTDFTHASPGVARVVFTLSEPPLFYLEHPMAPRLDGKTKLSWRQCSDWTEGAQATQVLRHTLFGSAPQLSHLVQRLKQLSSDENAALLSQYKGDSISSPFAIPGPPMAGLLDHSSHYGSASPDEVQMFHDSEQIRQTPNSGYNSHFRDIAPAPVLTTAYEETLESRHFGRYSSVEIPSYSPINGVSLVAPVSRLSTARPYTAAADVFPPMYPDDVSIAQSLQSTRRHTWTDYPTPPLLSTPFHPATDFIY